MSTPPPTKAQKEAFEKIKRLIVKSHGKSHEIFDKKKLKVISPQSVQKRANKSK